MAGQDRSAKDKQMASNLRENKVERTTGICCICYKTIGNDSAAFNHYSAHSRGASDGKK